MLLIMLHLYVSNLWRVFSKCSFSDIPHTFIPHFTLHSAEKNLDTLQRTVKTQKSVSFVRVHTVMRPSAQVILSVLTVLAHIPHQALSAMHTEPDMRILQINIQSINTSLQLLSHTAERLHCDIIALQEVWQPVSGCIHIGNFSQPILKIRSGKAGGGVALILHNMVKSIHLK